MIYRNALGVLGDLTYQYDTAGNGISVGGSFARTLLPDAVTTSSYDAGNRQLAFGGKTMTVDDNGNLLTQADTSGTITYTWDTRNRLTGMTGPSLTANFAYNGLGRRARKTVGGVQTQFLYDGLNVLRETSAGGDASYLRTLHIDEALTRTDAADTFHFLADALGSTVALTNPTGSSATTYTFASFGDTVISGSPSANPFQFTGQENDGTGLYFYRARYYNPSIHRFVSEDPIGLGGGDFNLYAYVGNNPVTRVDPLGLGYKDINVSFGFPFGLGPTGGVMVDGCQMYWYAVGGLMTPGLGGSVTASHFSPTPGWNFGLQVAFGLAGQYGYALGPGGGPFWELGIGGGFPTLFSGSLTGYYVFPPIKSPNCRPTSSKSNGELR